MRCSSPTGTTSNAENSAKLRSFSRSIRVSLRACASRPASWDFEPVRASTRDCPHCGKLAIVGAASASSLRQAETRWQEDRQRGELQPQSERDHLKELLDDSRFEG